MLWISLCVHLVSIFTSLGYHENIPYVTLYPFLSYHCSFIVLLPRLPVVDSFPLLFYSIFTISNMYINPQDVEYLLSLDLNVNKVNTTLLLATACAS